MIKKTIAYKNHNGQDVEEDFWFKITSTEFIERAMTEGGDAYLEKLQRVADLAKLGTDDVDLSGGRGRIIMDTFKTILQDAVGRREGDLLIKDENARNRFMYSGAYDAFFLELISGGDSGALFFSSVLPSAEVIEQTMKEIQKRQQANGSAPIVSSGPRPADTGKDEDKPKWYNEKRYPSTEELRNASTDELRLAMFVKEEKTFG